jgi:hypothetical protein
MRACCVKRQPYGGELPIVRSVCGSITSTGPRFYHFGEAFA